jgi:hypothetical protein
MNTEILQKNLTEEIDGREAHTEKGALKTLLDGKRNVAFILVNGSLQKLLEKRGYKIILVRRHDIDKFSWWSIVYNDKGYDHAHQLFKIARVKHGFLSDGTPIEAMEIGKSLEYTEDSIREYIHKKYGKYTPLLDDNPDNYNDLHEQNFPEFEKQIEKDEEIPGLNKRILFEIDDVKVCAVNADFVRDKDPGLDFNGFTDGGSHYVTSLSGYKKWIPEDEIWVDDVFLSKPNDLGAIILHEMLERHIMKYYGIPYDTAHADFAEKAESKFRKEAKQGIDFDIIKKIYSEFVKNAAEHHRLKKLTKDYKFQKTKDLMNKVVAV